MSFDISVTPATKIQNISTIPKIPEVPLAVIFLPLPPSQATIDLLPVAID